MDTLNQEHCPEGKRMNPPMPLWSPEAYASAAQVPVHRYLGHIVRTGGMWRNHVVYISIMRWDEGDNFLFEELGSRMRSQMRLSDSKHDCRSALD